MSKVIAFVPQGNIVDIATTIFEEFNGSVQLEVLTGKPMMLYIFDELNKTANYKKICKYLDSLKEKYITGEIEFYDESALHAIKEELICEITGVKSTPIDAFKI